MNLVAKEYVAAQVCETGVLLISQLAGTSEELPGASVINPYEIEGLAETIKGALEMPLEERRRGMRRMRSYSCRERCSCVGGGSDLSARLM
jgi:trehalose-6-phosphate synthase